LPNWGVCWLVFSTADMTLRTMFSMGTQLLGLLVNTLAKVRVNWLSSTASS